MIRLTLLFLAACAAPPAADEFPLDGPGSADATLPPPTYVELSAPPFVMASEPFDLTVTGAEPEEVVYIAVAGSEGDGACPRALGGYCLSLTPPLGRAGITATDGDGTAVAPYESPPWVGASGCFQAAIIRGPAGIYSALSNVVCVEYCSRVDDDDDGVCDEYDPCVGDDIDSDGDGLCDDRDLCFGDDNVDSDSDGRCDSVDECPGGDDGADLDGDGVCDLLDPCPDDPTDACVEPDDFEHDNGLGVIWYNDVPTGTMSDDQARLSCEQTYGTCYLSTGDCAGWGYCQAPSSGQCWGWQDGCSGSAGRIWQYGSSYTTYGYWN